MITRHFSAIKIVVVLVLCALCPPQILADNYSFDAYGQAYFGINGGSAVLFLGPNYPYPGFSWTDTYTNYSATTNCYGFQCVTSYSADLNGGSIHISMAPLMSDTFDGVIVSGTTSGVSCVPIGPPMCPPGGGWETMSAGFVGTWNNGWAAEGSFGGSENDFYHIGHLSIQTQTPEPSPSTPGLAPWS